MSPLLFQSLGRRLALAFLMMLPPRSPSTIRGTDNVSLICPIAGVRNSVLNDDP